MPISKSKFFIVISLAFALGIFLGSKFSIDDQGLFLALAVLVTLFAFAYFWKKVFISIILVSLFFLGVGVWRVQSSFVASEFENFYDAKQKWEGYIVEDIDIRTDKQLITFQPNGFDQRILITTSKYNEYFYGDWVVVEGKLGEPKAFDDFDYKSYLERYHIYGVMQYPKILVLKNGHGNWFKQTALKVKYAFAEQVSKIVEEPKSSLLLGILIGAKKTLPQNIVDAFNIVGLSHIVAVSGYNISVIIKALNYLARVLGRRGSFWLSIFVIAAFVIISGASASVLRAAAMGLLLLLSFQIGRLYSITPSICAAAVIMLFLNPRILFWDIGFQLSFLATMGIVYGVPLLEKLTPNVKEWFGIKGIILTTIAAIVATLPVILFYFGRLSTVALPANILVLPFIPLIMLFGFAAGLPYLGRAVGLIVNILLDYVLKITELLSTLPFASLSLEVSQLELVVLSLIVLLVYFLLKQKAGKVSPAKEFLDIS